MPLSRKVLLVVAVLFTLVNVGGAVVAGIAGEVMHTVVHVVLTVPGVLGVAALARGRRAPEARVRY